MFNITDYTITHTLYERANSILYRGVRAENHHDHAGDERLYSTNPNVPLSIHNKEIRYEEITDKR